MSVAVETIGLAAGSLTTASFLPQVFKIFRDRNTAGISLVMYGAFNLGVALWLVYGIVIGSLSITISNAVTLVLAGTVLMMKLRHG